ncbi:MAG TPA: glycosyltransferase family 39 protein, partial [Candidatus Polarisedimenticolia bacterium]|nr:glycosyltransferase family 39 protein [Candidatus Polarisedimenticolia bacterium]
DRYPPAATREFRWFGDRYNVVRPYFDHPPLFSLPVGLVVSLAGARTYLDCTLPVMRLVPILCSLIGLLMLHRLARAYGASDRAALLATLVYATLPLLVLTHRLVKAESLLSLLFMGALLAIRETLAGTDSVTGTDPVGVAAGKGGTTGAGAARHGALRAGIFSALSIWTKATGVVVPVVAAMLLLARRRRADAGLVLACGAAAVALYLLYGMAYDAGVFFKVLQAQSTTKWVSMEAFHDLLGGKVVVKWFGRGTYLWLLLAALLASLGRGRRLLLPLVVYGAVLALTADHRVVYGWYRLPLYPFLCIAAGLYLERLLDDADLTIAFPFAVTALLTALLYALPEPVAQARLTAWLFAATATLPFLPRFFSDRPWTLRIARAGAALLVVAFLVANVAADAHLLTLYTDTRGLQ